MYIGLDGRDDQRVSLLFLFFGAFLLLFGLTSFVIRGRFFLTTAPIALCCGIALGPRGANLLWILPTSWESAAESDQAKQSLLWFTRTILGIQVLSAGVTLPSRIFVKPRMSKSLLVLLGPVMLLAVIISAFLAKLIFPELRWEEAFVLGACLAPTDPVLAASVVKGTFAERHVPPFIRDLLLCESGINDGAATPYLMLPLFLLISASPAKDYFINTCLRETILGIVGGFAVGSGLRFAWDFAKAREWIDKDSRLVWTLALAIFTTGLFNVIDSNELLACYFCGTAMNWNGHLHDDELHSNFSEGIDAILDVAVFTTLGTILPWDAWNDRNGIITLERLALFGVAVIALRRLPLVIAMQSLIPEIRSHREAFFVGWFGPMGIGTIYYALKSAEEAGSHTALKQGLFEIVVWVVFLSTLIHGTTVPLLALGSSIHPSFHPKFLVDAERASDYGSHSPTLEAGNSVTRDQGEFITRGELDKLLTSDAADGESLNSRQAETVIGEGSGLAAWGRGRVTVFVEGSKLLICDEEGNVSVRPIRA